MALKSFDGGSAFVETDYIITANEGVPLFARRWIGDISGKSPEVNPLYHEPFKFSELSPQLVLVGGGDFVLPECRELIQIFKTAGLSHRFVVEWGQIHLYALGSTWITPEVRSRTDSIIFNWVLETLKMHTIFKGFKSRKYEHNSSISDLLFNIPTIIHDRLQHRLTPRYSH